ncbi:hypothetical protein KP509_08G031200 [Ceratopteris richardii]|uniref:Uncharacterized protein n=1 Tax=Ceratopteris richardii TaxID=49495 RepID=A0A8T2U9D9_CERRI|nr:hypothetical protein KP509_08G031200 [Ceratopteris richardii]
MFFWQSPWRPVSSFVHAWAEHVKWSSFTLPSSLSGKGHPLAPPPPLKQGPPPCHPPPLPQFKCAPSPPPLKASAHPSPPPLPQRSPPPPPQGASLPPPSFPSAIYWLPLHPLPRAMQHLCHAIATLPPHCHCVITLLLSFYHAIVVLLSHCHHATTMSPSGHCQPHTHTPPTHPRVTTIRLSVPIVDEYDDPMGGHTFGADHDHNPATEPPTGPSTQLKMASRPHKPIPHQPTPIGGYR